MLLTLLFSILFDLDVQIAKPDTLFQHYVATQLDDFPSSFEEFNQLFGYQGKYESAGRGILVELLYESPLISADKLCSKVIQISCNGVWLADQIDCLQRVLQKFAVNHPLLFRQYLGQLNERDQLSVWVFLFSGLYPDNYYDLCTLLYNKPEYRDYRQMILKSYQYDLLHPVE